MPAFTRRFDQRATRGPVLTPRAPTINKLRLRDVASKIRVQHGLHVPLEHLDRENDSTTASREQPLVDSELGMMRRFIIVRLVPAGAQSPEPSLCGVENGALVEPSADSANRFAAPAGPYWQPWLCTSWNSTMSKKFTTPS